ncbi:MAG: DUF4157 domain-containing protein [Chitinispirillales bacterium]|jgi:hypothetical protein|nr:DUF4157 domain-containing protein [Chitinispirillales bacterium]
MFEVANRKNSAQATTKPDLTGINAPRLSYGEAPIRYDTVQMAQEEKNNVNMTGIPDVMKTQFENVSGFSFDDVRIHYNSDKPARLDALAYTQGNQVHIAPEQEKHLGHELGHVVQQKQGRVRATRQVGGVGVNDEVGLEREADEFGRKMANCSPEIVGEHIRFQEAIQYQNVIQGKRDEVIQRIIQRLLITDIPKSDNSNKDKYKKIALVDNLGILWLMASEYNSHGGTKKPLECLISYCDFSGYEKPTIAKDEKIVIGAHGGDGKASFQGSFKGGDDVFDEVKKVYPSNEINPMFCSMLHHSNPDIRSRYRLNTTKPSPIEGDKKWDKAISLSPESGIFITSFTDCSDTMKKIRSPTASNPWDEIIDIDGNWKGITNITGDAKTKWDDFKRETNETGVNEEKCKTSLVSALNEWYLFIKDKYNAFVEAVKKELPVDKYMELSSPWKK